MKGKLGFGLSLVLPVTLLGGATVKAQGPAPLSSNALGTIALFFVLTVVHPVPTVNAAPPVPRAPQMSSANHAMDWGVAGSISGGESASANYELSGTIGQMAAGSSASSNYAACSGFQCALNALRVYLPLIAR